MKITKQRLKEIIKEELSTVRESDWYDDENETRADRKYADSQAGLGDIQSTDRLTGGSPEEQMLRRIKARELLAAMSKEELKELSLSLDAETVAELRHLLANPMYGSSGVEEGKVSSHRSEVTYSKEKRGKSKKPEKKAYNKADRAQAKRDLKK
jgi:ATP-dependent RNA circularization protein (DNA/RNA ligase family)